MKSTPGTLRHNRTPLEVISTGSLRLDLALGLGGIPRGCLTVLEGPESAGKTTLCQHIVARAQAGGGVAAFIDADGCLEPRYARRCGVDLDQLYFTRPHGAEQALDTALALARSGALAVLVIDSIAALVPQGELSAPPGTPVDQDSASDRLLAQALPVLAAAARAAQTALLVTLPVTGSPHPVYRGLQHNLARLALKLHDHLRIHLTPAESIHEQGELQGIRVQIRIVKNEFAPCSHPTSIDIMYNEGIRSSGEIFDLGVAYRFIQQATPAYFYQSLFLGKSRSEALGYLHQHPALQQEIEAVVRRTVLPVQQPELE